MDSIKVIELLLEYGRRTTTYKFGVLLSIVDYTIENPMETPKNNFHLIPIFYIAKQFFAYYYPFITSSIRQGPEQSPIALEGFFNDFQKSVKKNKSFPFLLTDPSTVSKIYSFINTCESLPQELIRLIFLFRKKILEQPLKFIRNLSGKNVSFFSLLTEGVSYDKIFDEHRLAGFSLPMNSIKSKVTNWESMERLENCHLFIGHQTYQEISTLRFWLRDVLIKRWAQECVEKFGCINPNILAFFDLWNAIPERNSSVIRKYRDLYLTLGLTNCIYCGSKLIAGNFDLDHFLPWSRFPINRFWNLYPSCSHCNGQKSDKIPLLTEILESKVKNHLVACIAVGSDEANQQIIRDIIDIYKRTFKSECVLSEKKKIEVEILEYLKGLRSNLLEIVPGEQFDHQESSTIMRD